MGPFYHETIPEPNGGTGGSGVLRGKRSFTNLINNGLMGSLIPMSVLKRLFKSSQIRVISKGIGLATMRE
jgi:hypothetical protein